MKSQWPCINYINSGSIVCCECKKKLSYDQDDIANPTTVKYREGESEPESEVQQFGDKIVTVIQIQDRRMHQNTQGMKVINFQTVKTALVLYI